MEWALGIDVEDRRLVARVAGNGRIEAVPLDALHKRGLPAPAKTRLCRATFNLAGLTPVCAREYCEAFQVALPPGTPNQHQVFEVRTAKRTFVIPSLVLMRALFRPTRYLLPMMFAPQALSNVCWVRHSEESAHLVVDASWATQSLASRHRDWVGVLAWMIAHPSGCQMANSIHANAMSGAIKLAMPDAICRASLSTIKIGKRQFVTSASFSELQPLDTPSVRLAELKSVLLHRSNPVIPRVGVVPKRLAMEIPRRADGSLELSDHEWALVEQVLRREMRGYSKTTLCQRGILDGILAKLASGTPWKASAPKVGAWTNATFAYRNWSKQGTFAEILRILGASRAAT